MAISHPNLIENIRKMKTKHFFKTILAAGLLAMVFTGCDPSEGPLVEEIDVPRVFAPTSLEARVRNMTAIELDWFVRDDAESYVVEFAEGENDFSNIVRTITVTAEDLPAREEGFSGQTFYSIRVKGVAEGKQDSNWTTTTIQTDPEQIFLPIEDGDIQATEATLRWPENSEVTNFIINPGNINRPISVAEKTAGIATITGLTGETEYTVTLHNNNALRGTAVFTTLIDIGDATLVQPTDDLSAMVAAAADGDTLVLMPGDYTVFSGDITVDKSITIQGLYPYDMPKVYVSFTMAPGLQDLSLVNLEMIGMDINADPAPVQISTIINMSNAGMYNSVTFSGCYMHDYGRQLIYGNTSGALLNSFVVDNCVATDFTASGGDFIDFRNGDVHSVSITNSTFVDAPSGRDFIRMDGAGDTNNTGVTATVLIDHCTFVGVSNTADRITYVRFVNNDITVTNNIFADTDAKYSNQTSTDEEMTFSMNNYFNAPNMYDSGQTRYDTSSNYTTLDPGFVDAANRDYTVTNQDLIDDGIGDPRWLN